MTQTVASLILTGHTKQAKNRKKFMSIQNFKIITKLFLLMKEKNIHYKIFLRERIQFCIRIIATANICIKSRMARLYRHSTNK